MTKAFPGRIGRTIADSEPYWPDEPKAPSGAPNILVVLFDDTGFSDFGCYRSPIKTPTIDRLAAEGLRYTGFHTTAMCSTTRAAMLTGRNPHSVGVGSVANFDSGYPGYRGKIAKEAGTIAEILRGQGYRNYMVGKWHVTPLTESGSTGPFDGWPLGRGFDGHVPTDVAPDLRSRNYLIEALVELSGRDQGVLIAHGDMTSGYSLYVEDGRLVHDLNVGGHHVTVRSNVPIPNGGAHCLGVRVDRLTRIEKPTPSTGPGTSAITLMVDGTPVGRIETQYGLPNFIAWSGLDIGRDRGSPVANYNSPFAFTGRLLRVEVTMDIEQHLDGEGVGAAIMARE